MGEHLDLIVLGGYYGEGRRGHWGTGGISHFLMGVACDDGSSAGDGTNGGASVRRFHTFCKVGSGYNLEVLEKMRAHFKPHLQEWKDGNLPPHYARCKAFPSGWWPAKRDDVPDLWLPAEHSLVLEVMGSSITDTDQFRYVVDISWVLG